MPVRPFTDTLRDLRRGHTLEELGEALNTVVAAVRKTGKAGAITLKLTVSPASKGDIDQVRISDVLTTKVPELDRASTIFFATVENNLQRTDPRQQELKLTNVNRADAGEPEPSQQQA